MQGTRAHDAVATIRAGEERSREMQVEIETVKLLRQVRLMPKNNRWRPEL